METLPTLVHDAQQGDLAAFGTIVERFRGMAYTTAYMLLHDTQLAEDAVQEAFIEAYQNLSRLQQVEAFPGWFQRIVFKQGDRLLRRKQLTTIPLEHTAADLVLDQLNPAIQIEQREAQAAVQQAIQALPEHERIIIVLFYGQHYSYKEISDLLEKPLSTIKKRLFDARKHLKEHLLATTSFVEYSKQLAQPEHFPDKVQLLIAIRSGDTNKVQALIEHNPFLINGNLGHNAIQHKYVRQITPTLPPTWSALHEAVRSNHISLITLLLDYGANIDSKNHASMTPLHEAIVTERSEIAELLLNCGANINAIANNGLTALHYAIIHHNPVLVNLLLRHHASPNVAGSSPKSPLHWAVIKEQIAVVALLLSHDADHEQRDELDRTPLDWAQIKTNPFITDLLQQQHHGLLLRV